jgi:hypothetical protein
MWFSPGAILMKEDTALPASLMPPKPPLAGTENQISRALQIRGKVMARNDAGYFIHEWQELRDQVRLPILHDPRCKTQKGTG